MYGFEVRYAFGHVQSVYTETHIGELTEENLVILVTMTVPEQIEQMSVNLKAPIIVNADTRKGAQIICENNDYEVKYKIYDILNAKKGDC